MIGSPLTQLRHPSPVLELAVLLRQRAAHAEEVHAAVAARLGREVVLLTQAVTETWHGNEDVEEE